MSQHSFNITALIAKGGTAYRAAVNLALQALVSNNLGSSAAETPYEGMLQWFDEETTWTLKAYTGVEGHEWVTILSIDTSEGTVDTSCEPALGNPASDGHVLSSTAAGVRSWVAQSGGGSSVLENQIFS